MSDSDKTPVWHTIVGEGYEPVPTNHRTKAGEDILIAGGWVPADDYGFIQLASFSPRRRRKPSIEISTRKNGLAGYTKTVRPGDCFVVCDDGELLPINTTAEGSA